MQGKIKKLHKNGHCKKCGRELPICVPPYLRPALKEQGRLCDCDENNKL